MRSVNFKFSIVNGLELKALQGMMESGAVKNPAVKYSAGGQPDNCPSFRIQTWEKSRHVLYEWGVAAGAVRFS